MKTKRFKRTKAKKRFLAKRDPKTQAIIDACVAGSKADSENRKKEWQKQYAAQLRDGLPEPQKTSKQKLVDDLAAAFAKKSPLDNRWKKNDLDDEMAARERKALDEMEKRFASVAPSFNKGPLQPISKSDLHTIGKKV